MSAAAKKEGFQKRSWYILLFLKRPASGSPAAPAACLPVRMPPASGLYA